MSVVIDASLFGPLLIPDEASDLHAELMPILIEGRALVPQHWRLELANIGLTAVRRGRVGRENALAGLATIDDFEVETDSDTASKSLGRTLQLADQHGLTSYDAAYLELAERKRLPLFTRDRQLIGAAIAARVELFGQ